MDIFICDEDTEHTEKLKEICFKYLFKKNIEAEVCEMTSREDPGTGQLLGLFMISTEQIDEQLVGEILLFCTLDEASSVKLNEGVLA